MLIKNKFYSLIVLPYLADTTPSLTKLLAAKEAAGSGPAWWLVVAGLPGGKGRY